MSENTLYYPSDYDLIVKVGSQSRYEDFARNLRGAVYGLWSGKLDYFGAVDTIMLAIARGLTHAWEDGMSDCGMTIDDMTDQERYNLETIIYSEYLYVIDFANAIVAGSKSNQGLLRDLYARASMWTLRYQDIQSRARVSACGDKKLIWQYGDTKHCRSCLSLHGKVKRASFWQNAGVLPQNPVNSMLECEGWRCRCQLLPTNLPISPGPLPSLP